MIYISQLTALPFFIIFLLLGSIERIVSTFSTQHVSKTKKKISNMWFITPFCVYLIITVTSIGEFFFRIININLVWSFFGLILYLGGVLLRRKAISDLGNNWSVFSEVREEHILITCGIFRFLRNPYYVAVMMELSGICLVANSFYTLILVYLIQMPLLLLRIFFEERLLAEHFSSSYELYKRGKII